MTDFSDAFGAAMGLVLDFDADLYGQAMEIELVERLRDEQRFGSTDELAAQISRDIERARTLF